MKKILTRFIGIFVATSILATPCAFAGFSDVLLAHPNYNAINYLQKNEVVEGYKDGTFKPNNEINRAEFLKIILEGSNIRLDIGFPTPFPDVDHTSWYAPYVKKAYAENWIQGYPDGTFRPSQNINKVEALKILGEVQNWQLPLSIAQAPFEDTPIDAWYTPYLSYAKNKGFLEKKGHLYNPANAITRGQMSEVIYRTMIHEDETETPDIPQDTDPPEKTEEDTITDFTPVDFESVSTEFFRNITLTETLPTHFYKNEVYYLEGQVTSDNSKRITIILEDKKQNKRKTFHGETKNNYFSIPIHFRKEGNYLLGIIPGATGSGSAKKISVLPDLPEITTSTTHPTAITNQQIYFSGGKTYIDFNTSNNTIKRINFKQNNREVEYLIRQNKTKVPVNYADFINFKEGTVNYSISVANISSSKPLVISSDFNTPQTRSFQAIQHQFSETNKQEVEANPPETLNSVQKISFTGKAEQDLRYKAYVIKPDGFVENVSLSTTGSTYNHFGSVIIRAGGTFTYNYTPSKAGTYIVEINNLNGEPALNHTVYVATGIPLLPDFFDLLERTSFTGTLNLTNARQEMLTLINQSRSEHGLSSITISTELNSLAQNHSLDMANNNFFGHINLQGQTPEDRRIEAGIKTPIGENLAKDISIIAAHHGLMRSASHRDNILTPQWTRAGIGVVEKDGHLFITQIFSIDEVCITEMENMGEELFNTINNARSAKGIQVLTKSSNLETAANYINNKLIQDNAPLNNALFNESLNHADITGSSTLIGRISSNWITILESIINEDTGVNNTNWERMGIDIQIDSIGNLHTMVVLNKP